MKTRELFVKALLSPYFSQFTKIETKMSQIWNRDGLRDGRFFATFSFFEYRIRMIIWYAIDTSN